MSTASAMHSLTAHNSYFDSLVNMFPASLYLTSDLSQQEEEDLVEAKFKKGLNKDAETKAFAEKWGMEVA